MEPREELELNASDLANASGSSTEEVSLLDALAGEREELASSHTVDIQIPGYNKIRLFARYRLLDGPELNAIGRKVQKEFRKKQYEQNLYASIDIFIAACVGFFYEQDGGERLPLTCDGSPVTGYTEELARALRFADKIDPASPARSIVFGVFGNNEVALQGHSLRVGSWMQDTSLDVDEEFIQGNS